MDVFDGLRTKIAKKRLNKEQESPRLRKGNTLTNCKSFALVYKDTTEERFNTIKKYLEFLKSDFGIPEVRAYAYVDKDEKNLPPWQIKHQEFDFFFRKNVKWNMEPSIGVTMFTNNEFDILVDLSRDECIPISYVVARSKAKMKVGRVDSACSRFYDFLIDVDQDITLNEYLKKINLYLTKFDFK